MVQEGCIDIGVVWILLIIDRRSTGTLYREVLSDPSLGETTISQRFMTRLSHEIGGAWPWLAIATHHQPVDSPVGSRGIFNLGSRDVGNHPTRQGWLTARTPLFFLFYWVGKSWIRCAGSGIYASFRAFLGSRQDFICFSGICFFLCFHFSWSWSLSFFGFISVSWGLSCWIWSVPTLPRTIRSLYRISVHFLLNGYADNSSFSNKAWMSSLWSFFSYDIES